MGNDIKRSRVNSLGRAAEILGISRTTLWRMIRRGDIVAVQVAMKKKVITDAELDRILAGGIAPTTKNDAAVQPIVSAYAYCS
jgi:hypothetical protein